MEMTHPSSREPIEDVRDANALLCRVLARLKPGPLAGRVAAALRLVYEAQGQTNGGMARQMQAAAESERLLVHCLREAASTADTNVSAALDSARLSLEHFRKRITDLFATGASQAGVGFGAQRAVRAPMLPLVDGSAEPPIEKDDDKEPPRKTLDELKGIAAAALAEAETGIEPVPPQRLDDRASVDQGNMPAFAWPDRSVELVAELVDWHIARLAEQWRVVHSPSTTWRTVASSEDGMRRHISALILLEEPIAAPLVQSVLSAKRADDAFAAATVLLAIEGIDTADSVFRALEQDRVLTVPGLVDAFRRSGHREVWPRLPRLLIPEAAPAARAAAVDLLGERNLIDDVRLSHLLADRSPVVVAAAAELALRRGKKGTLAQLESLAEHTHEEPAATMVLVAASLLGSARVRNLLRGRLRGQPAPPPRQFAAIAACGDEADIELLATVVTSGDENSLPAAVRALGWLGSARALPLLHELSTGPLETEATHALVQLTGEDANTRPLGPGRWFRGSPWTATAVADILAAPETTNEMRELAFFELVARTGQHVPFDCGWAVEHQQAAVTAWRSLVARLQVPTQRWLYRGLRAE